MKSARKKGEEETAGKRGIAGRGQKSGKKNLRGGGKVRRLTKERQRGV